MNVSSVILRVRPDKLPHVREDLTAMAGVEVHADPSDGRMVLTIEDSEGCSPSETFIKLHQLDGVLSASLVYQYCDDDFVQERES
jgi:nitrate reductase NapD